MNSQGFCHPLAASDFVTVRSMEDPIVVDPRAQRRLHVLNHVLAGGLTAIQAAELLEMSLRQVRRLLAAYRTEGLAALVHGAA